MSSIIQFLRILALFFILNHLIHTCALNFPTPRSPIDTFANYEHGHSGIHLVSQDSTPSAPKLRKPAFGRVNTIATAVTIIITLLNIVVYKLREIHEANLREKYKPSEQSCRRFLLADILSATKNFDESLVVGKGGFGKVYRGVIDGGIVAVKRLNPMSMQGAPEFWVEIEMLSRIRHSNIVSLIGYCNDCDEMILIYEYMVHGTLADNIHRNRTKSALPWAQRVKICIGAAHGLDYLHTGTGDQSRIIHRDVKSTNILLGENWTAKVSDFGMAKIGPRNQPHTHVSTNVKGTFGYLDPEYFLSHQLTRKSDVYAFGVVLFEVLCGRRAVDLSLDVEQRGLAGWAQQCIKEGKLDQIIDPSLRGQILPNSLTAFAQVADQCLHMFSTKRPTMAEVVVALELALQLQERTDFSIFGEEFFNMCGDHDNQENAESSIKEEAVINGGCNNQDKADSSVKDPVVANANNDFCHNEKIEGIVQLDAANNEESAHSEAKPPKKSEGNDNNVGRVMLCSGHTGDPNLKLFTYAELVDGTYGFSRDLQISKGRYGMLYKGWVYERPFRSSSFGMGMAIAVKKVDLPFLKLKELKSELEFRIKFSHPNLVKILGYCWEEGNFFIVYQYMQEESLESHLFRNSGKPLKWVTRLKIAIEAARGLAFLHTSEKKVIYGEFMTSNILLDRDFNAKLWDFEQAELRRVNSDLDVYVPTLIELDTYGYAYFSPEYMATGHSSSKSDVYSFGVVLLEILTGQRVFDSERSSKKQHLVKWARPFLIDKRRLKEVMDTHLEGRYPPKHAFEYAVLVSKCLDLNPKRRPSMEEVLKTLEHINQDAQFLPVDRPATSEVVRMLEGEGFAERWEKWQNVQVTRRVDYESPKTQWVHRLEYR